MLNQQVIPIEFYLDKAKFLQMYPNSVSTTMTSAAGLIRSVYELYNALNGTIAIQNVCPSSFLFSFP